MTTNRWTLTDKAKEVYTPIIQEFIDLLERTEEGDDDNLFLDFSDKIIINPYTLWKLLEELGYETLDSDQNGWQMDYWIYFHKKGFKKLCIEGTAITHAFKLKLKS
jgi:hypothetical protein